LSVSSSDIGYAGLSIPGVGVTNTDDDTAGLTAAPSSVSAAEGTGGSYQLSLSTVPSTPPLEITLTFDSTQLSVNGSTSPVLVTLTDTTPLTVNFMSLNNALVNNNRVVVITNTVSTSSAAEYPVGTTANVSVTITEGVAVAAVPTLPPPPPVEPAGALNFDEDSVVRVSVPDALGDVVRARVMYARGSAETWLGAPLYDAGNIGNQGVVDLGVLQAIDIFSANDQTYYDGGAVFCLQGQGTLIWMPASQSPRAPQIIGSYTVPEFPGFTCATLFEPGTLVLVSQNPLQ
ncbi:MAG TPA: hypothetical protein VER79_09850, partial [Candidatus Limnocylindrales bacterium]|nr:hypothetical protein [Candidatus Limnocylindrales bacterium]